MKRFALLTIIFVISTGIALCQDTVHLRSLAKHKVYTDREPQVWFAELGGPGIFSANYDRRLEKRTDGVGIRVGLGYSFDNNFKFTTIPFGVNYLLGHTNNGHFLEVGVNETLIMIGANNTTNVYVTPSYSIAGQSVEANQTYTMTTFCLGYRSQPNQGGFNFRAGLMPVFFKGSTNFGAYLSFGYNW